MFMKHIAMSAFVSVVVLMFASLAHARPSEGVLRATMNQPVELQMVSGAIGRGTIVAYNDRSLVFINESGAQAEINLDQIDAVLLLSGKKQPKTAALVGENIAISPQKGIVIRGAVFAVKDDNILLRLQDNTLQYWRAEQLTDILTDEDVGRMRVITDRAELERYATITPTTRMLNMLGNAEVTLTLVDDVTVRARLIDVQKNSASFMDGNGRVYDFPIDKMVKLASNDTEGALMTNPISNSGRCGPQSACLSQEMADYLISNMIADRYETKGAGLRGIGKIMMITGGVVLGLNMLQWGGHAAYNALEEDSVPSNFILTENPPVTLAVVGTSLLVGGIVFKIAGNAVRRTAIRKAKKNPLYSVEPGYTLGGGRLDFRMQF